jgi:hypothetical protein
LIDYKLEKINMSKDIPIKKRLRISKEEIYTNYCLSFVRFDALLDVVNQKRKKHIQ